MKKEILTKSQINENKVRLILENFHSVMGKIDKEYIMEDWKHNIITGLSLMSSLLTANDSTAKNEFGISSYHKVNPVNITNYVDPSSPLSHTYGIYNPNSPIYGKTHHTNHHHHDDVSDFENVRDDLKSKIGDYNHTKNPQIKEIIKNIFKYEEMNKDSFDLYVKKLIKIVELNGLNSFTLILKDASKISDSTDIKEIVIKINKIKTEISNLNISNGQNNSNDLSLVAVVYLCSLIILLLMSLYLIFIAK